MLGEASDKDPTVHGGALQGLTASGAQTGIWALPHSAPPDTQPTLYSLEAMLHLSPETALAPCHLKGN